MDTRRKLPETFKKPYFLTARCCQMLLTYGAEAWGLIADHTVIERVHLFAIKLLLNISAKTSSALVYGEADTRCTYKHTPNVLNIGSKLQEWQKTESHLKRIKCWVFYTVKIKTIGSPMFASHFTNTVLDMYGRITRCRKRFALLACV